MGCIDIMNSSLHKRALFLSYFTVGYNILEGVISILVGLLTGSVALVGFGSDSFVESLSGSMMIWRFTKIFLQSINLPKFHVS